LSQYKSKYYPETNFGGFSDVDGTIAFYSHVNALTHLDSTILDIGCGRGSWLDDPIIFRRDLRFMRGKCLKVIGLDIDPKAAGNLSLDEFRLLDGNTWPVSDSNIDLCVCDYVVEHVQDPPTFFSECWRVLKPGGYLCIRTTNLFSYFGIVAKLIPNRDHIRILRQAKERVLAEDIFPTFFRCNTIPIIKRHLARNHFNHTVYGYEAEPGYLSFSGIAYYLGVLHQKFVPGIFRIGIHAFAKKNS
jgi:ubiquinone/menaquinone biosynthesis C-methylase UbiE